MFTDKEYRILLSAMSREMEVCKKVDSECYIEPYEVSLEDICKSIKRKIMDIQYKYVWHLRPENGWTKVMLPKENEKVLLKLRGNDEYVWMEWTKAHNNLLLCSDTGNAYIAWMYIPPVGEF